MNNIIGIHGYGYTGPAGGLYRQWERMVQQPIDGIEWYSGRPFGLFAVLMAWLHGCPDTYAYAYRVRAPAAGQALAVRLATAPVAPRLVAHSLGAAVALEGLFYGKVQAARVLLMEGALLQIDIPPLPAGVQVLNICTRSDLVLRDLGSVFNDEAICACIGRDGRGAPAPGWKDVFLDDPATIAAGKKRRWELRGSAHLKDTLREAGGHTTCYDHPGNWPLYRAWLAGDNLEDIP